MISQVVASKAQPLPESWLSDAGWSFLGSIHDVNIFAGQKAGVAMIIVTHAWGADMVERSRFADGTAPDGVIDSEPMVTWKDVCEAV